MTLVYNIATGEQQWLQGDPHTAVKTAFVESYGFRRKVATPIREGKQTVSCGYWTALKQ